MKEKNLSTKIRTEIDLLKTLLLSGNSVVAVSSGADCTLGTKHTNDLSHPRAMSKLVYAPHIPLHPLGAMMPQDP